MARILSEEQISGIAPSPEGKPAMLAVGRTLSEGEITGRGDLENQVAAINTPMGAVKDIAGGMARRAGSMVTAAGDLIVGVPGSIAGHLMNLGTRLYGTAKGERADIVGQAGQLAENLGTIKVPGTKLEVPLEPLKTPLSSLLKMATGTEPWDQSAVEHLMDSVSDKISKFSGGKITKEDVLLGIGVAMDAGGIKGGQMAAKGIADAMKPKPAKLPPTPLEPAAEVEAPKTEASKYPGPAAVEITSPKQVQEIFDRAKKRGSADERDIAWVKDLFEKAKQPKPAASVTPLSPDPTVVKTRLTDGRIIGEDPPPPMDTTLQSALDKVSKGQRPDLTAEERIALQDLYKTSKIVDQYGQPISSRQGGKASPEMLLWLTGLSAATAAGVNLLLDYKADVSGKQQPDTTQPFLTMDDVKTYGPALMAAGWVKAKGGMWHPEAVERLAAPLKGSLTGLRQYIPTEVTPEIKPVFDWSDRAIRNYLNKHAGTEGDPLKDVEIPFGAGVKRWEEITDSIIRAKPLRDTTISGLPEDVIKGYKQGKISGEESIWDVAPPRGIGGGYESSAFQSYISHVGDYLRQNVPAEKLAQYDLVRAVKETAQNDARVAKEMEKAAAASTKDLPVYKEYPDGMKWVELKLPEKLTAEQAKGVREATRDEAVTTARSRLGNDAEQPWDGASARDAVGSYVAIGHDGKAIRNSYTEEIAIAGTPEEAYLAGRLAEEGNQMGHCVGGYCEGVASGESRIFSLRDKKGKSHVTIEVGAAKDEAGAEVPWTKFNDILQIKGKQNRAPVAEYLPYVQDFVKSGKWGEVGDLQNTGLAKGVNITKHTLEAGNPDSIVPYEILKKFGLEDDKYYTPAETREIARKAKGLAAAGAIVGAGLLLADEQDEFTTLAAGLAGATVGKKGGKYSGIAEPKLIEAMKAGEQGAFTELYNRTKGQAERTAASFGNAAEDIVQRSYEKAFRAVARGDFKGDSKFSTYLHTIIQNEGKNRYKFEQRRPTESIDQPQGDEGGTIADTLGHEQTPEAAALNAKLAERMQAALDKLPPNFRKPFEMRELEGKSYEEIAQELGLPINTVRTQIHRAKEQLQNQLKDYRNLQAGYADRRLLTGIAAVGIGATVGAALDPNEPLDNAVYGALAGGALGTGAGRAALKTLIKSPDAALGLISTRLGNITLGLKFALRDHELRVLKGIDAANDAVLPFIQALKGLSKEEAAIAGRALLNGDADMLQQFPTLRATLPGVQKILGSLEGQLKSLGRFGEGVVNYFPRLVKDFEGLKNAIGQEAKVGLEKILVEAEAKMIKKEGRSLTDVEESIITNRYLFGDDVGSFQPGWAKGRKIKNIPENLMEYYEKPAESLLRYVSGAINDLETARFFGRDLASRSKGKKTFTDVDDSIGNLTARLLREGKISQPQAMEIRNILKARFESGNKGMNTILAGIRDTTNTALLGNIASAATQIGDSLMTMYHHGLVPTLQAVAEKVLGKQRLTPKDLGLINHVAEELSDMRATGKMLHVAMKYSAFHAVDMFAKGLGINAALIKAQRMLSSPKGEAQFRAKYQEAFNNIDQVIKDLKQGKRTADTDLYAFSELSDAQPVSKAEMPEMYLANPNGRLLYQLKTYMLKQTDIVRRDAYQEMAKGTPEGIMRGAKNLAALGTIYALANVPGDVVKDLLSGRTPDPFSTPKLVENVFQTFGVNRYAMDRLGQGKVTETVLNLATPPVRVLEDIAKLNAKSFSYFPGIGRPVYDRFGGGNERREIYETRLDNKGKKPSERKPLSPEAKAYLRKKRLEEKAKKVANG